MGFRVKGYRVTLDTYYILNKELDCESSGLKNRNVIVVGKLWYRFLVSW